MKNFFDRKKSSEPSAIKSDDVTQIGEIKKQLDVLEKKIDSLLSRSASPQSGRSQFSHQGKRNRDHGFKDRNLTQATCAACNRVCEVHFKPTGDRPVYCSDCFSKRKQGGNAYKSSGFDKPRKSGFESFFKKNKNKKY